MVLLDVYVLWRIEGARERVLVPIPVCGDYVVRLADRHCLIDCSSWHRVERRVVQELQLVRWEMAILSCFSYGG
ncbi:hypothetical protein CDV31_016872 [Fusarium ambrosium]|uniref:Uncharacterized protein n=1 Tax=Fusarium ambrosium TaxID=131363 RepID=A0A428S050_9HYPO|nr:hypothetical protein CDV31_016872 [Fusarium ambrosium]